MHQGMIEDAETCLREVETYFKRWNGKADGRVQVWYGARSLGACTPELYSRIAQGANRLGTGITMHLGEVQEERQVCEQGVREIARRIHGSSRRNGAEGCLCSRRLVD